MDCTEAITRDLAYVKAFCRRASARVALKNCEGARDDYRRVLELEPNNRLAQTEIKAVEQVEIIYILVGFPLTQKVGESREQFVNWKYQCEVGEFCMRFLHEM